MTKKRKSGGRTKGKSGNKGTVQCTKCGRMVPSDKAKKYTKYSSVVDPQLARELRKSGSYIHRRKMIAYYCVSCAVHTGKVQIRQASRRKR